MKCYMCNRDSISREHVPPDCFFSTGHRLNLITVPSCPEHNFKKSKDDEYIHSIIAPVLGNNSLGEGIALTKVNRSFQHSTGLVAAVFKDAKVIKLPDGVETVSVQVNLDRWDHFFEHFSNAIYYHDFKTSCDRQWHIWSPSLRLDETLLKGQPDPYSKVSKILLSMNFVEQKVSNPEIFRYFFFTQKSESFAYKFLFYEAFVVCALSTSVGRAFA